MVTSEKYVDEKVDENAFKAVFGELAKKLEAIFDQRNWKDVPAFALCVIFETIYEKKQKKKIYLS